MNSLQASELQIPEQQDHGVTFPLIYGAGGNQNHDLIQVEQWIEENKQTLLDQLAQHGAILFRGFPINSDLAFDQLIQAFGLDAFTYEESLSNAVRRNRTERVFTANEAPPEVEIYLHHEMAQTPIYPSKLFFYCEQAAQQGGATPLCRSDVLLNRLDRELPEFVERCESKGVRYTNIMPSEADAKSGQGRSWKSTLNSENEAEAESRLAALHYDWRWQADSSLRVTTPPLPAVRVLDDGRRVFFNQLIAAFRGWNDRRNEADKSIRFGDDSPISTDEMNVVSDLSEQLTFDLAWQTGDMALVDNFLVMHGRRPFQGERRVLASLVK